jgi:hypothetical protein
MLATDPSVPGATAARVDSPYGSTGVVPGTFDWDHAAPESLAWTHVPGGAGDVQALDTYDPLEALLGLTYRFTFDAPRDEPGPDGSDGRSGVFLIRSTVAGPGPPHRRVAAPGQRDRSGRPPRTTGTGA